MNFNKIGIAGAGIMGASMAQIFAKYGYQVIIYDAFEKSIEKGKELIRINQNTQVSTGEETREEADKIIASLVFSNDMSSLADCDIIVESIIEKLDVKQEFWSKLSRIVRPDTILTTNTSGLSINSIATDILDKSRFLGMHWINPSNLIPCIEIIRGDETSDEAVEAVISLSKAVGKNTVVCKKDVPGFIINRLQLAILRESIHIVEDGIANIEDVDACMKYSLGFRYAAFGPFEVVDFGGIDTFHHIASYLNADLCRADTVQPLLDNLYKSGNYGVKSGKGFYDYSNGRDEEALRQRDEKYMKIYNALYRD